MTDKTTGELAAVSVGDLPAAPDIYDDFKMPGEFQGEAVHVTGSQMKEYAVASVSPIANAAAVSAAEASLDAAAAKTSAAVSEGAKTAAQSALYGVQSALNNIPAGSTLVINDLTTGGTKAALSAEMGKTLNDNKLDKGGGTMTGALTARQRVSAEFPNVVTGRVEAHSAGVVDLQRLTTDGKYVAVRLADNTSPTKRLTLIGNDTGAWFSYDILHTGNKSSGSYTGNGSARTVNIGGIGKILCIMSTNSTTFVTPAGGVQFNHANGMTTYNAKELLNFTDGVLTFAPTEENPTLCNTHGAIYTYQVL